MKFECGDLERALATPELMPEAREHLKECASCRREFRLWNDISSTARQMHQEWDSPDLWPNIRKALEAEPKPKPEQIWWKQWKTWAAAAVLLIGTAVALLPRWRMTNQPPAPGPTDVAPALASSGRDFLTEQAFEEVERAEAAYRRSIDKLAQLAQPKLANAASASAVNCKEKLTLLDSAISDTRANLDHNRFNAHLQMELADLYREKKKTLEDWLSRDQKN